MASKELENLAKAAGYSRATIRRAKDELKEGSAIVYGNTGTGSTKFGQCSAQNFPSRKLT